MRLSTRTIKATWIASTGLGKLTELKGRRLTFMRTMHKICSTIVGTTRRQVREDPPWFAARKGLQGPTMSGQIRGRRRVRIKLTRIYLITTRWFRFLETIKKKTSDLEIDNMIMWARKFTWQRQILYRGTSIVDAPRTQTHLSKAEPASKVSSQLNLRRRSKPSRKAPPTSSPK